MLYRKQAPSTPGRCLNPSMGRTKSQALPDGEGPVTVACGGRGGASPLGASLALAHLALCSHTRWVRLFPSPIRRPLAQTAVALVKRITNACGDVKGRGALCHELDPHALGPYTWATLATRRLKGRCDALIR